MIESKKSLCTCIDHCRIGSLEITGYYGILELLDHCRIGSLETKAEPETPAPIDHCRIGSLERMIIRNG